MSVNPLEVESPYWKRDWLKADAPGCLVHHAPLVMLQASRVRNSRNMTALIKRVGIREQERELARQDRISRIFEHSPFSFRHEPANQLLLWI